MTGCRIGTLLLTTLIVAAQTPTPSAAPPHIQLVQPQSPIVWTRTALEAGVSYNETDKLGELTHVCPQHGYAADVYGAFVQWPGAQAIATRDGAERRTVYYNGAYRTVVFNGTNAVYSSRKQFGDEMIGRSVTATLSANIHCLDADRPYTVSQPQVLAIRDRIPLHLIAATPTKVKGGRVFGLTVVTSAPATDAGIRVNLTWTGTGKALLVAPPDHVDIISGNSRTIQIATRQTRQTRTVIATASTKGIPKSAKIVIRP